MKKNLKSFLLWLALLTVVGSLSSFGVSNSQNQITVSGKVSDTSGEPLPGVTVVIKGTTQGTITNDDGEYSLLDVNENTWLVFSFVGMKSKELQVGEK